MLQLPLEQEIVLKYQTLSRPLRDALESRYGLKHIREVAKRHALIEEDVEVVLQLVGLSLTGFLNPRDLAEELFNFLELRDRKTIDALAKELTREILAPLKNELQNLYRTPNVFPEPATKPVPQPAERPGAIRKEEAGTPPTPVEPFEAAEPKEQQVPIRKEGTSAAGPAPMSLETLRMAPEPAPVPQTGPVPAVKAAEPVTPLRPAEPAQAKIHPFALGEIPVKPVVPAAPAPAAPAVKPAAEATPAPFMLHKEEAFAPILGSKQIQIQREAAPRPETGKATAVRLEMTGLEEGAKKKEGIVAKTEVPQQRVVHYSTFRTPINPFGEEPAKEQAAAPAVPTPALKPAASAPLPKAPPAAPTPPQKVEAPKAKEEVIDLSTFQRAPAPQPKLDGNVVDLRGRE